MKVYILIRRNSEEVKNLIITSSKKVAEFLMDRLNTGCPFYNYHIEVNDLLGDHMIDSN